MTGSVSLGDKHEGHRCPFPPMSPSARHHPHRNGATYTRLSGVSSNLHIHCGTFRAMDSETGSIDSRHALDHTYTRHTGTSRSPGAILPRPAGCSSTLCSRRAAK